MKGDSVVRAWQLTKRYGHTLAVDRLTMEVRRGEVFGFLGPNGAGKTTTIAMLLGLVRPTSGTAEVLGQDLRRDLKSALRRTGATIESPSFYPYLSGRDNLRVIARILGHAAIDRVDLVLDRVGLGDRGRDPFKVYSMGMKQRLALAAAMLNDPEFYILDEPTNGLDPAGIQETRQLLRRMVDDENKSIFLSSHLLHEVQQVCDRVVIIDHGRVVAHGLVRDLLAEREAIEVELLEGEFSKAEAALMRIQWVRGLRRQDNRLHIAAPPERARDVTQILAGAGVFPSQLTRVSKTLEDLFLELTGKGEHG
jgi:ABC-2 type transport system ATP-binding protein